MSTGFEHQPVGLRAPRIPFDLRCVILAALGYLVLIGADWGLGKILQEDSGRGPMLQTLDLALSLVGGLGLLPSNFVAPDLAWWKILLSSISFFAIWAFFGAAILRTAALRLTRDEPLPLGQALSFGCKNWLTFVSVPVIVGLFAGFFILCNMAAGLVMSVWGVGSSILVIILFPLVLISSLMITLSILGGLVTLPLMWAAASVEQNGAIEAVSRTFSYLFARPFRFFFGGFLILLFASIILFLSSHYEHTLKATLQLGIVRTELDNQISRPPQEVKVLKNEYANHQKTVRQRRGISDIRNVADARWYDQLGVFWMWLLLSIFMLCFRGYAIYVLLGGTVSLYLQLRSDVDGADESEIYPPLDQEELDREPKWVGGDEATKTAEEPSPEGEGNDEEPAGDPEEPQEPQADTTDDE